MGVGRDAGKLHWRHQRLRQGFKLADGLVPSLVNGRCLCATRLKHHPEPFGADGLTSSASPNHKNHKVGVQEVSMLICLAQDFSCTHASSCFQCIGSERLPAPAQSLRMESLRNTVDLHPIRHKCACKIPPQYPEPLEALYKPHIQTCACWSLPSLDYNSSGLPTSAATTVLWLLAWPRPDLASVQSLGVGLF